MAKWYVNFAAVGLVAYLVAKLLGADVFQASTVIEFERNLACVDLDQQAAPIQVTAHSSAHSVLASASRTGKMPPETGKKALNPTGKKPPLSAWPVRRRLGRQSSPWRTTSTEDRFQ